jgi:hypothetical protein
MFCLINFLPDECTGVYDVEPGVEIKHLTPCEHACLSGMFSLGGLDMDYIRVQVYRC